MESAPAAPQGQATQAPAPSAYPASTDQRGVPDVVSRIQNIINAEEAPSPSKRTAQETTAPTEQPSAPPAATPEPEAQPEPNKQVEGDEAPTEDARQVAEIPLDQLEAIELEVTIKGEDGKDVAEKQSIKALREGYMRQADYSRKTAEIARQREQLQEQTRKASEAVQTKYLQELQTMHDLVSQTAAAELAGVNWNDLATNNAFEYVRLDNRKKEITKALESIRAKQQEVLSTHQAEQAKSRTEQATKARAQLEADIPGWNDTLYQSLMKAGIEKYGYKQDEVAAWVDPRAFKLLHKASLYDQMQSEKTAPAPDKKVVVPPKVVKPGAARDVNLANLKKANEMKQLRSSGRLEDAAAVIRSRLG